MNEVNSLETWIFVRLFSCHWIRRKRQPVVGHSSLLAPKKAPHRIRDPQPTCLRLTFEIFSIFPVYVKSSNIMYVSNVSTGNSPTAFSFLDTSKRAASYQFLRRLARSRLLENVRVRMQTKAKEEKNGMMMMVQFHNFVEGNS